MTDQVQAQWGATPQRLRRVGSRDWISIHRRKLAAATGALSFCALLVWALFPGVYSPDSVIMMWQAIGTMPLMNWHPTLLVRLWSLASSVTGSSAGVWLAQSALAGLCAYRLLRSTSRPATNAIAVALLFFPPLWGGLAMTWKDTQLALIWWLVALAMMTNEVTRRTAVVLLVGVIAIAAARYNSIGLAVGPAWLASQGLVGSDRSARWIRLARVAVTGSALVVALMISVGVGAIGVERRLHPEEASFSFDIVGIGVRTGDVELPHEAEVTPACALADFRERYRPQTSDFLVFGPDACVDMGLIEADDGVQHVFFGDWFQVVIDHPLAYIQHRTRVTLATLGVTSIPPGAEITGSAPSAESFLSPTLLARPSRAIELLAWCARNLGFFYRPYLWVIVAAVAVRLAGRHRRPLTLVLGSTLLNLFLVCMTTPAADLRYSYPVMITMIVSFVVCADDRLENVARTRPTEVEPNIA